jgi:rare lipoprotein A (peptidoglycan hydrolase)
MLLVVLAMTGCLCAATSAIAAAGGTSGGAAAPENGTASPTPTSGIGVSEIATFFGPGLYGRHTACGQTLTPEVVGVANRTLPCGTLVQVTYAGHALTVPVLDRGPYSHSASWDLTVGAAHALGITETVRIGAHVIGKTANSPALGLPTGASSTATATGGAAAG